MIRVFTGEDTFRSHAAYSKARDEAAKLYNLHVLRDENLTEEKLAVALRGQTMFGGASAVAVEGVTAFTGKRADSFVEIISSAPKDVEMLFWEKGKPEVRLKVWSFLKKNADKWEIFGFPTEGELRAWVSENVRNKGGKISQEAISLLVQYCGADLWSLSNELEKLLLYKGSTEITSEDVRTLTPSSSDINVFTIVRALVTGDRRTVIKNLVENRKKGEDSRPILSLALREVRTLLAIKDMQEKRLPISPPLLGAQVGVRDFVVEALQRQATKVTTAKMRYTFDQMVVSLYSLNNGRVEADDVLDLLALQAGN